MWFTLSCQVIQAGVFLADAEREQPAFDVQHPIICSRMRPFPRRRRSILNACKWCVLVRGVKECEIQSEILRPVSVSTCRRTLIYFSPHKSFLKRLRLCIHVWCVLSLSRVNETWRHTLIEIERRQNIRKSVWRSRLQPDDVVRWVLKETRKNNMIRQLELKYLLLKLQPLCGGCTRRAPGDFLPLIMIKQLLTFSCHSIQLN